MTLQPKCEDVETAEGVAITVTGVAQVNHHTFLGMPVQTQLTPLFPPPLPSFLWHQPIITAEGVFYTVNKAQDAHINVIIFISGQEYTKCTSQATASCVCFWAFTFYSKVKHLNFLGFIVSNV